MALVSQLAIEIAAKAEKVKEGLSAAMQYVLSFANSAANIIGKAFSGIGGIIANVIKNAFDQMGDAQDRLSTLIGRSNYLSTPVKDIQALDFAVNKAGGGIGSMDVAVRTMMKNVSQAVSGAGPAAQAIKDLGLNAGLLAKMNLTQQLVTIQVAMSKLKDQSKSKGIIYQLFGESILPNIAIFNKGLGEQFNAFEKLGTGIDSTQEKIIRMNMAARTTFNEMKEGFINQFTIPFLDVMTQVINAVQKFIERSGGIKIAAATLAKGVLDIFQSVAQGLGGVEGVILRLDKALTNVLITYNKAKMMGSGLWDSTKAIGQTLVNTVSRSIDNPTQPGWKTIKMGWDDAHNEINETASKAQQNIVELSTHLSGLDGKLKKIGDSTETVFSRPIATLEKYIIDAKDPIRSLAQASVDAASNVSRYSNQFTDAQAKAANKADDLADALKKAADKAESFLANPQFKKPLEDLIKKRDKEDQKNERDIPEYIQKMALEAYDNIAALKTGESTEFVQGDLHRLAMSVIQDKADRPRAGTTKNIDSIVTDLQNYLKQKELAATKVKVDINLDITDEMKKIIKVNGIFTNQDTIDNRMKLTGQNMLNLGLQSAAAAANS
jgi:hypothetical protein